MKVRVYLAAILLLAMSNSVVAQQLTGYSLTKGSTFTVTSELKQDIEQSVFGQVNKITQAITTVDIYEVVEVTEEGYRLKTTGTARKMEMTSPQGNLSVDSELEGDEHLMFRALSGKSYFLEINRQGKVLNLDGLDDFGNAVKADLAGTSLEASAGQLIESFNEKTVISGFEGQFYIYPESNKSEWNRQEETSVNNLPVFLDLNFSWSGSNTIDANGTLTLLGEVNMNGIPMMADISGTQNNVYTMDKDTGLSRKIVLEQDMKGDLEVQGTKIPMTLKTRGTVTIEF